MNIKTPKLHPEWIDSTAYNIVDRLQKSGFETYLVGGCVRDLLVGIHPKDFDIATNALPDQVRRKISHSYVIGKRFRLVLVKRGSHQYEVATFRRNSTAEETSEENPIQGDNFFGSAEEDARRRDFTLNALFYDPIQNNLIDYCSGLEDIKTRVIRVIGHPPTRFVEDPIRILRAVRLAHKLRFQLDPDLRRAAVECASELQKSVLPRRREEFLKILKLDHPSLVFHELHDLGILREIVPNLDKIYIDPSQAYLFQETLEQLLRLKPRWNEPQELFSIFLFAYIHCLDPEHLRSADDWENDENLLRLMKDELGVFKLESLLFFKAFRLKKALHKIDIYRRKGPRRQRAFLTQEGLDLSLFVSWREGSLASREYYFWLKELERLPSLGLESANFDLESDEDEYN